MIVTTMAKNGITLELNTASIRKGLGECTPDLPVLRQYVQAGGKRVTIGSDTHNINDVDADIAIAAELANIVNCTSGVFVQRRFIDL